MKMPRGGCSCLCWIKPSMRFGAFGPSNRTWRVVSVNWADWFAVIDIGFIGLRPTKVRKSGRGSGRKVMKPFSELNPRVWQGDCLLGIDQKRSEMFQDCRAGGPVSGTDSVHHPDNTARHPLPTPPRFSAVAGWVQGRLAIALTNGDGPKLFPTAKRFSSSAYRMPHPISPRSESSASTKLRRSYAVCLGPLNLHSPHE
jgi:hypothetical protein